jgi:hypothetical protein
MGFIGLSHSSLGTGTPSQHLIDGAGVLLIIPIPSIQVHAKPDKIRGLRK